MTLLCQSCGRRWPMVLIVTGLWTLWNLRSPWPLVVSLGLLLTLTILFGINILYCHYFHQTPLSHAINVPPDEQRTPVTEVAHVQSQQTNLRTCQKHHFVMAYDNQTRRYFCAICDKDNEPKKKFCRECGAKIPRDSMYCEECGRRLVL